MLREIFDTVIRISGWEKRSSWPISLTVDVDVQWSILCGKLPASAPSATSWRGSCKSASVARCRRLQERRWSKEALPQTETLKVGARHIWLHMLAHTCRHQSQFYDWHFGHCEWRHEEHPLKLCRCRCHRPPVPRLSAIDNGLHTKYCRCNKP